MKKWIALLLAMVLVLSLCATAFAAKPSVSLAKKYQNQTVKRGKTVYWTFKLKCGSYKQLYGYYWRASFDMFVLQGSVSGKEVGWYGEYFTGNGNCPLKWKVPKTLAKGKYVVLYGTSYRKYGGTWKVNSAKTTNLKLK